jgi:hypothetical protein
VPKRSQVRPRCGNHNNDRAKSLSLLAIRSSDQIFYLVLDFQIDKGSSA